VAGDLCDPALALRAVLLVQLAIIVVSLAISRSLAELAGRLSVGVFAGLAASLLWLVLLCALKGLLRRTPSPWRTILVLALGAATALVGWLPLVWVGLAESGDGVRAPGVALVGAALAGLLWRWLVQRAARWQPAQARARLAELQDRIRPHFLFNALNSALALVRVDPERAEAVLLDLSELFRGAMADTGGAATLDEEIDLARRYLAIEQVRFGARLRLHWDIDPQVGSTRVPPLMLQPLVENAVRHGVEPAAGGGDVWVRTERKRGQTVVQVRNTLPDGPSKPGNGIALANLRERLMLLHDVAAQCDVWRDGGMFHARIVLPA
jgi:two-component system sensor histidine kinase AlgZ